MKVQIDRHTEKNQKTNIQEETGEETDREREIERQGVTKREKKIE